MLDFTKVKRIFVFGCSFTQYVWPTWANMVHRQAPSAEFYNFGLCGSGNISIVCKLTEINAKMSFNENDLVAIMWTTYCREDRYVSQRGGWMMTGNIFTQKDYDEKFVEQFADPKGYMIRDLGLIVMATQWLKLQKCQTLLLPSVPFDYQQKEDDPEVKKILETYEPILSTYPRSMFDLELERVFTWGHIYRDDVNDHDTKDYHPSPIRYWNYLQKVGVPLSADSFVYAVKSTEQLKKCKLRTEIEQLFVNENTVHHKSKLLLF